MLALRYGVHELDHDHRRTCAVNRVDHRLPGPIEMDFFVNPGAACVADIGLLAGPGGQRAPTHDVGFHQRSEGMADGGDRLLLLEESLDESYRVFIHTQRVRIGDTAGEH